MKQHIYMTPKQPLFVTASKSYLKYVMNRFGIVHFYQCKTGDEPCYAIPDGCVDMVFCCDETNPGAEICGTVLSPKEVLFRPDTCYFGIRFLPGYNPVLGCSSEIMKELVNHQIPFSALVHDERMLENIFRTTDFRSQITAFMNSYMSIYNRMNPMENSNLLVRHISNLLIRFSGDISIEQIAIETGYTERYIEKCFQQEVGLTPKQFSKIIRFQSAVSSLNNPSGRTLTEIAIDAGYFDQAHFVRDFKGYAGLTPKKYQRLLAHEAFNQKLEIII